MKSGSWKKLAMYKSVSLLEHPEHAVGHEEAADDVDRPEGDRDHEQELVEEAGGLADQQQAAEQHDPVDRVRRRHQRRVQGVRHLRDHLEADEGGEHEDGELGEQIHDYAATPAAARAPSWTISPTRMMQAPASTSSSKSRLNSPSLTISSSSDWTLRERSDDAWSGIEAGRFTGPTILTPSRTTVWPASVNSQLPPVSAARSTITEPGLIFCTAPSVTSSGALRPGTAAVEMTASILPISTASRSRCLACSSSVSWRA